MTYRFYGRCMDYRDALELTEQSESDLALAEYILIQFVGDKELRRLRCSCRRNSTASVKKYRDRYHELRAQESSAFLRILDRWESENEEQLRNAKRRRRTLRAEDSGLTTPGTPGPE